MPYNAFRCALIEGLVSLIIGFIKLSPDNGPAIMHLAQQVRPV